MSHNLTQEQVTDFGGEVTTVSPELKAQTSAIPAVASAEEIKALAAKVVAEAISAEATHFSCMGEPTLVLYASLAAHAAGMILVNSTTERVSVDNVQADGTVVKTAIFKHVQWRTVSL